MTDVVDTANDLAEHLISAELAEMRQRQAERDTAVYEARTARNGQDGLSDSHCIGCGEIISEGRLLAMPHAVRCIVCQNELELNEVM